MYMHLHAISMHSDHVCVHVCVKVILFTAFIMIFMLFYDMASTVEILQLDHEPIVQYGILHSNIYTMHNYVHTNNAWA